MYIDYDNSITDEFQFSRCRPWTSAKELVCVRTGVLLPHIWVNLGSIPSAHVKHRDLVRLSP